MRGVAAGEFGRRSLLGGLAGLLLASRVARAAPPPLLPRAELVRLAGTAIDDLLRDFWDGPAATGHIRPTWGGFGAERGALPNARGSLWERAMLVNALFEFYQLTGAPEIAARLRADWSWVRGAFSEAELTECGRRSHANWASDDTGWDTGMFLQAHDITGDPTALRYARLAVGNAYGRWHDAALGGGLWYSDERRNKSIYEAALALAALRLNALTRDSHFLDAAAASEAWMRTALRRPDGLYWCETTRKGPVGLERPRDIHPGGSVTYLGGNMAVGVLEARLAGVLGRPALRQAALETARGVVTLMVDADGVLIDDRDAWNDGYFAPMWAREVIPGHGPEADTLRRTAAAIATRARTPDGYYGPDWDGPSADSRWSRGKTRTQQIMTSASAATMIVAAAFLP